MKIGTKSVLFGAHQFLLHPWFVAFAWWKLYGFPFDPRLWVSFFVHDLGYIGKPNMDGPEGDMHPHWGACLMGTLFGRKWYLFTLYHSRFLSKNNNVHFSKLCVADKLALVYTPGWLYLPLVKFTGEIDEYRKLGDDGKYESMNSNQESSEMWWASVQSYLRDWVDEHKDMKEDNWTPVDSTIIKLEKENASLKSLVSDLLNDIELCSNKLNIIQPFLTTIKKHAIIINKHDLFH
jgi:hypothetical protein